MKGKPNTGWRWQVTGLTLGWLLITMIYTSPVRGDVGVRPILPGGSSLKPQEQTPIQMLAEKVVMSVRPATEADNALIQLNPQAYGLQFQPVWFPAVAEVEADFTMKNPTSGAVDMIAWFPLASALESVAWDELNPEEIVPRITNFQVTVDGQPVEHTVSELPNPKGAEGPPLPWASFPVSFPAGQETNIHVRYVLPLLTSTKGTELAVYYIFQTGAGWAGPIGQAELVLNLPYPASAETLAIMPPSGLNLPYFFSDTLADLPAGAVMEGNQARWTWLNLEPGPEDDFAVWLVDLGKWQALEAARGAVQANPNDGPAWLEMASVYRSLSTAGYNHPSAFSPSYLAPGVEAYQKAAELLPEHPAPHLGLALLSLAPYMKEKNAPPEVIQSVQDELTIARELEAKYPSLAGEAGISSGMLEDVLSVFFYNDATATADWLALSTAWAAETLAVVTPEPASATPVPQLTHTPTPAPSFTPQPSPTAPPPTAESGRGLWRSLIRLAVLLLVIIAAYLALRRRRGGQN